MLLGCAQRPRKPTAPKVAGPAGARRRRDAGSDGLSPVRQGAAGHRNRAGVLHSGGRVHPMSDPRPVRRLSPPPVTRRTALRWGGQVMFAVAGAGCAARAPATSAVRPAGPALAPVDVAWNRIIRRGRPASVPAGWVRLARGADGRTGRRPQLRPRRRRDLTVVRHGGARGPRGGGCGRRAGTPGGGARLRGGGTGDGPAPAAPGLGSHHLRARPASNYDLQRRRGPVDADVGLRPGRGHARVRRAVRPREPARLPVLPGLRRRRLRRALDRQLQQRGFPGSASCSYGPVFTKNGGCRDAQEPVDSLSNSLTS